MRGTFRASLSWLLAVLLVFTASTTGAGAAIMLQTHNAAVVSAAGPPGDACKAGCGEPAASMTCASVCAAPGLAVLPSGIALARMPGAAATWAAWPMSAGRTPRPDPHPPKSVDLR